MTLFAAIGKSQGLDAAEAAIQATDQALASAGRHNISLAIIAAAHDFPVQQVVNGVAGLLSDTPLLGFSTPAQITAEGIHHRSVVIALLVGDQIQAESDWWCLSSDNGNNGIFQSINFAHPDNRAMLVVAEGLQGDAQYLLDSIPQTSLPLAGCLAGGEISEGRTFQIGGSGYGTGGIAASTLRGNISLGISSQHGWQPVGMYSRVTHAEDLQVQALDGRSACEVYAEIFGYPARDWTYPPLNQLVRLYPFGLESETQNRKGNAQLTIRSALFVEKDGSLRMNSRIPQGETVQILVSSIDSCLSAARFAAEQAVKALGEAVPVLALVYADTAWQMMLQSQPGMEISAIRDVIGEDVPIIGGYTLGQVRSTAAGTPELLNQHIQVVLFGDPGG